MYEANYIAVLKVANLPIQIDVGLLPAWSNGPFVVGIFVVVARDLLLIGSDGIRLDVRVQEATSPAHVLQR
jgi:hypothetical protein